MTDSASAIRRRPGSDRPGKRERLIAAAVQLLHQQGIERTTLADIAQGRGRPGRQRLLLLQDQGRRHRRGHRGPRPAVQGNARLHRRRQPSPEEPAEGSRQRARQAKARSSRNTAARIGSLCSELDKRAGSPGFALAELMRVPIEWAEKQFRTLGRRDAHDLAVDLIAAYEGSALLANTLRDPDILSRRGAPPRPLDRQPLIRRPNRARRQPSCATLRLAALTKLARHPGQSAAPNRYWDVLHTEMPAGAMRWRT